MVACGPGSGRTILALLRRGADDAVAIGAPGRAPLTYGALRRQVARTGAQLGALGIRPGERVATALPPGADIATLLLGLAAVATAAPLNPAEQAEAEAQLGALGARALIVQRGAEPAAVDAARALGVRVIELLPDRTGPAGVFGLRAAGALPAVLTAPPGESDTAFVLRTSGTTSGSKLVPLSHRNVWEGARNVGLSLALSHADRALGVMPLFHVHGLVAVLLASLAAGGSVICAPGFDALRFPAWVEETRPTWYSGVPAMHDVLARRAALAPSPGRPGLRLIRSASAPLSPRLADRLESLSGAPVVDSYSMTEAGSQITASPLPPRPRRSGTVGLAAGPEVAIMDATGDVLPPGNPGEIVVRGPSVTRGYEGDPAATATALRHGWLWTGDLGVLDADGYLTLTGRIKELINRGGEKVAPLEVERALLEHPAVAEAVCFALPHPVLGEEVAAAVVLGEGQRTDEPSLRRFATARLAASKVPRRLAIVEDIPRGPTGKVRRLELLERLAPVLGWRAGACPAP